MFMQQHSEAHSGAKFQAKSGTAPWMKWASPLQVGMGCLVAASVWISPRPVVAQIIPDQTLGGEPSIVVPGQLINGIPSDRIDGGAIRGTSLFHSLQEFNIDVGRGAYFANPTGIENILTRITGNNPSDILGTLGVLGNANLFLINPNGIFFGSNARLDIAGSFTASTANAFTFPDGSEFSATHPQAPPLLTINITPGLQYGSASPLPPTSSSPHLPLTASPTLTSQGILTTGKDLTLAAHTIDLQGELWAGGDLTLTALDTLTIRDRAEDPFVAVAGRNLLAQGNQLVDIFALNHRDSGFYSGGNMTFRSANPVGGDAHYWAGGNFQIEQLDGSLGKLHSPYDPIIVTPGSVRIFAYTGASLHIIAGGFVEILGPIEITGADNSGLDNTINPGHSDPFFASLSAGTLPDGTPFSINGSTQPTLDIRAGITCPIPACSPPVLRGGNFTTLNGFTNAGLASDANIAATINVGSIQINAPDGQVFLSNNHLNPAFPNNPTTLAGNGSITVGNISTDDVTGGFIGNAGGITINARGALTIPETLNAASTSGNGGTVRLVANGDIQVQATILTRSTVASGQGGSISITSLNGIVDTNTIDLDSSSLLGDAGGINLRADGNITIGNILARSNAGDGGNIRLESSAGGINTTNGNLDSRSTNGKGGDITLQAQGAILTANLFSASTNGQGGDITVISDDNFIDTSGGILGASSSAGVGGNVTLDAFGDVTIGTLQAASISASAGNIDITSQTGSINLSSADIRTDSEDGNGGDINLTAFNNLNLNGNLEASGQLSGDINLTSNNGNIFLTQSLVRSSSSTVIPGGVGGSISLEAPRGDIQLTQSRVLVETTGAADSGNLLVTAQNQVNVTGTFGQSGGFLALTRGSGKTGTVTLSTNDLQVNNLAQISAITAGAGNSGDVILTVGNSTTLDGGFLFASTNLQTDTGDAGTLTLDTNQLTLRNRGVISAASRSSGDGGSLVINARDSVLVENPESQINLRAFSTGNAGTLALTTGKLTIRDQGEISATTQNGGEAGSITLNASESIILQESGRLLSDTLMEGNAGAIKINTRQLFVQGNSEISARTGDDSTGRAGTLTVRGFNTDYTDVVEVSGATSGTSRSRLAFDSFGTGQAGELDIQANEVRVLNGGQISGTTRKSGEGGRILVNAPTSITISGSDNGVVSSLEFDSRSSGNARGIILNTSQLSVDGGLLTVSGKSSGSPGDIDINATTGNLSNQASLTAETITSGGGNIRFQGDVLTLDASKLSTSTEQGIGGTIAITANDEIDLKAGSTIASQATGTGDAGAVTITTAKLSSGNSTISTSVVDGTGGTIAITANDEVDLKAGSTIASQATGTGDAGAVTITTAKLSSGNSTISTSVVDGTGGTIAITANDEVDLKAGSTIASQATGIGDAGAVTITTAKLSSGNSTISTSVVDGTGGTIAITANNTVGLNRSTIASEATGTGDAGAVTIATGTLSSDESTVSTSVVDGIGGTIAITANDEVDLKAGSTIASEATGRGDAGAVTITTAKLSSDDSTISTSVVDGTGGTIAATANDEVDLKAGSTIASQATGTGDAGAVTITTAKLSSGNSTISTSVVDGTGGTIAATATTAIVLTTNSRFTSEATGNSGTAGTIQMTTPTLQITDSQATVRGLGNSTAGNVQVFANQTTLDGGTVSATTVAGSGGNITLSGQNGQPSTSLTATNTSVISASTQDGQGGSVAVQARQFILLDQDSRLEALASGDQGRPGDVTLTSDRLTIQNNARASVSAVGIQDAGNFTITAAQVQLDNGGQLIAETVAGTGGNIDFQGLQTLTLDNNSALSTSTQDGQGGNLPISATTAISLGNQSQITAAATGRGSGGIVSLAAPGVTLQDGAAITTTAVDGAGGSIRVNAPQSLQLARAARITTEASGNGSAGDIQLLTTAPFTPVDGVQITVSNTGTGNAGNLTIAAPVIKIDRNTRLQAITNSGQGGTISFPGVTEFTLDNNSVISTETRDGVGGAIVVDAPNQLSLNNGSKITSSATGNGNSGDIRLTTNNPLTIANGSQVTVNSDGTGQGGVIFITANALSLSNNTLIGATTESGKGGNINIQVADSILLRFNSDILTEAKGAGDGGNMVLKAGTFIGAILSEDSDIIAGAVTGLGGKIDVMALLVFGFRLYSGLNTPESDFTARSQFGIDGEINLNTQANPALEPLPDGSTPPSIANTCSVNPAQRSSYRQMGSGGISPLPGNALTPNTVRVNLVSPVPANSAASQALSSQTISPPAVEVTNPAPPLDRIVEAQGWIRLADGTIVLTANPTLLTVYQAGLPILTCGG